MFAVPGWSLGTPKAQEVNKEKTSKKRKREHHSKENSPIATKSATNPSPELDQYPRRDDGRPNSTTSRKLAPKTGKGGSDKNASPSKGKHHGKPRQERRLPSWRSGSPASNGRTQLAPHRGIATSEEKSVPESANATPLAARDTQAKLTPMQAAMRQKLVSARFRHLNQTLYTSPSAEAQSLFESNPSFFDEYHTGFRQQVSSWPENPVDSFVQELKDRGKVKSPGKDKASSQLPSLHSKGHRAILPRSYGVCTVADLGCGDGRIASFVQSVQAKLSLRILSFDLQSNNHFVTKADISNVPLEASSVDVAILCLALMGTNWISFLEEAWRILRWKGELWIAEIKSRFGQEKRQRVDHSVGKKKKKAQSQHLVDDENNQHEQLHMELDGSEGNTGKAEVSAFVQVLERRGFVLQAEHGVDMSNKMFVKLRFLKAKVPTRGRFAAEGSPNLRPESGQNVDEASVLKPCLYKIR